MGTFLLVCICGGLGAVARFMLNTSIQRWWHRAYPLSTFIINIIAALCAGTAAAAPVGCGCSISLRKSGVTGSCGAPVAGENDWES